MSILRFYIVSFFWIVLLCLLFLGVDFPNLDKGSSFNYKYCIQYFVGYGWLTFLLITSFKKQLRFNLLRFRAFMYAMAISTLILLAIEIACMFLHPAREFQIFWNLFGLIGIYGGKELFRLVYRSCY